MDPTQVYLVMFITEGSRFLFKVIGIIDNSPPVSALICSVEASEENE